MIRIGLAGAGGMGTAHYTSYSHTGAADVVAVVGVSEQDAEKASKWKIPIYPAIPEMLAAEEIDIVDICTPTYLHGVGIRESIAGGKHVITETPIALRSVEAQVAYEMAEGAGVRIYVAQALQFYKESELLRRLVKSGEYGRPLDAYFTRLSACPRWAQGGWLFDKKKSGLVPYDLHIDDLDLIVSVFGRPLDFKFTSCGGNDRDYPEHYRFSYSYDCLNVTAEAGWLNADIPFTAGWRVYFENAMVVNEGGKVIAYGTDAPPRLFDTEEKVKIPVGINVPPTGTYLTELTHFLDCFKKGVSSDRVRKEQVFAVLEILENLLS
jgi:predicted dehydrogenase